MKKPRLTEEERLRIEAGLNAGSSICEIARALGRPRSTVTREVRRHAVESAAAAPFRINNRCVHRMDCLRHFVCAPGCTNGAAKMCRMCGLCNRHCVDFEEQKCGRLAKAPFVCNGCPGARRCVLRKKFYGHAAAHAAYLKVLSESRTGANVTEGELLMFNRLLHDLSLRGQSVHAAMVNNPAAFTYSEKTIYRYIAGGLLLTKRGDLPRACSLKPRRAKSVEYRADKLCRVGRTHEDYLGFTAAAPGLPVVQMDTVEGVKGGKAVLTLMFNPYGFMLAFLLEEKTSARVSAVFASLRGVCGDEAFSRLFPVILTDNGTEFTDPLAIERNERGDVLTFVFYCAPQSPYQKAEIERNHVELRRIFPKGTMYIKPTSFDNVTQGQLSFAMSNLNSYVRPALGDRTPYDLFTREHGEQLATALGIVRIAPNDVTLKPSLLGIEICVKDWVRER